MKVTLESTDKIVELTTPSGIVPARLWEGRTESGIACHAFVTRIAVHADLDSAQFGRELVQCRTPSADLMAYFPDGIPLRLVL
jgi:hypothetical protein